MRLIPTVLIAPDKFKGSLTAREVANAVAAGFQGSAKVLTLPSADGGDGSIDAVTSAGFEVYILDPSVPSATSKSAVFARKENVVFIEAAEFCGLSHITGRLDPLGATTLGVGCAVRVALDLGARTIVLGVGGTSSTDGGLGFLIGLGAKFSDETGDPIPLGGRGLSTIAKADFSELDPRLRNTQIVLASDVESPLLGSAGAARLYAPQKGATSREVEALEVGLTHFVAALEQGPEPWSTNASTALSTPGAGAGGGLGFAALLVGASRVSGADYFLDLLGFDQALSHCDLVVTGEGVLDHQSLAGKLPIAVAARARARNIPVVAVVGTSRLSAKEFTEVGFERVYSLDRLDPRCVVDPKLSLELLTQIGKEIASRWDS